MTLRILTLVFSLVFLNSCLKTRADINESEQYQVYNRKNVTNQHAAKASEGRSQESQLSARAQSSDSDANDELIRSYNGKIETLENQISLLQKDKVAANAATSAETQKLQALQESLTKMDAQIQLLQNENANLKAEIEARKSSDEAAGASAAARKQAAGKTAAATKSKEIAKTTSSAKTTTTGAEPKANVKSNPYDVAQEFFAKKEWKKAILSYQKYVDEFPKGKNVPEAKYRIGVCFQELGMKEEAAAFYEEVVAQHPKSDAGKRSKIRLSKLKKK